MPTTTTRPYRPRRPAPRPARRGGRSGGGRTAPAPALPGWGELAPQNERVGRGRAGGFLDAVPTLRFALLILAVAAALALYVGHVHATQDLLADVQRMRRDNLRLHMQYNRIRGEFDRATGPAVVYERARRLGLEEDIRYGPTIEIR